MSIGNGEAFGYKHLKIIFGCIQVHYSIISCELTYVVTIVSTTNSSFIGVTVANGRDLPLAVLSRRVTSGHEACGHCTFFYIIILLFL